MGGLAVAYRRKGAGPATMFLHGAVNMWEMAWEHLIAGSNGNPAEAGTPAA